MTDSKPYHARIEQDTLDNTLFRKVVYTGKHLQVVLMSLAPGGCIPNEVHQDHDQFIRVEAGTGVAIIDGVTYNLEDGVAIVVPAGKQHEVKNTGDVNLKLYSIYGPPEHAAGREDTAGPTCSVSTDAVMVQRLRVALELLRN